MRHISSSVTLFSWFTAIGVVSPEQFNALTCDEDEDYCIAWPESFLPNGVNSDGRPQEPLAECADRVDQCAFFAGNGECVNNPGNNRHLDSSSRPDPLCNKLRLDDCELPDEL